MKTSVRIVEPTVTTPIAPHVNHQCMWDVGIDDLKDAVWVPEENKPDINKPPRLEPGLDCLRYAVWTPENTHSELVTCRHPARLETRTFGGSIVGSGSDPRECFTNYTENLDAESDLVGWTQISRKSRKGSTATQGNAASDFRTVATSDGFVTDHVIELQAKLEKMYPECGDLSSMSPEGFRPHLTLGQCDTSKVEKFVKRLKQDWRDMEFDVKEVHVITRKGQADPFQIVRTIPLGMSF